MQLVQTTRDALLKPLSTVAGIVERRNTMPILANILVRKTGDTVSFVATDLEVQITTHATFGVGDSSDATTVAARKLLDILRALPDSGNVRLSSAFEMLRAIERASSRAVPQRVVVEAVDEHWQPRVENDMPQTDGSPTTRNAHQHAALELAAMGSAVKDMKTVLRRRPAKPNRSAEHHTAAL